MGEKTQCSGRRSGMSNAPCSLSLDLVRRVSSFKMPIVKAEWVLDDMPAWGLMGIARMTAAR